MRFEQNQNSGNGYGSNWTPYTIEQMSPVHSEELKYRRWLHTYLRKPYKEEADQSQKIEVSWNVRTFFRGTAVYNFHTTQSFNIIEPQTAPTPEVLEQLVQTTFKWAQKAFSDDKTSFPAFNPLADLTSEEVALSVQGLTETLALQQA